VVGALRICAPASALTRPLGGARRNLSPLGSLSFLDFRRLSQQCAGGIFLFMRYAMRMSLEAEVIWLRLMEQVRREDAVIDRMRAVA